MSVDETAPSLATSLAAQGTPRLGLVRQRAASSGAASSSTAAGR